jgi:transposase-like protein
VNQKKETINLCLEETEGARRATGVSSRVLEAFPPDPEVRPKETRRRLTRAYKLNILEKADQITENGELGALLRREGLYSSQLALWRKQRREGFFEQAQRRGRPGMSLHEKEQKQRVRDLEKKVQSLEEDLKKASIIIDVQKKLCDLLGLNVEDPAGKTK